jgi:hypothetical protein
MTPDELPAIDRLTPGERYIVEATRHSEQCPVTESEQTLLAIIDRLAPKPEEGKA